MKATRFTLFGMAALVLLSVVSFAGNGFAATDHPLSYPYGIAVDASGNLYVANTNSNQVLVYNPSHVQLPSKTITTNVAGPTGVAFDPSGNLWVANSSSSSVTEYSPSGAQIPSGTITNGVSDPAAIAVDGLADIWVNNGYLSVSVYPASYSSAIFTQPFDNAGGVTSLATHQMNAALGTNNDLLFLEISPALAGQVSFAFYSPACFAVAFDSAGDLYCGDFSNSLMVVAKGNVTTLVANLGFLPTGIAVDSTHKLVYVSNGPGNEIAVYSTSGKLVTTIQ